MCNGDCQNCVNKSKGPSRRTFLGVVVGAINLAVIAVVGIPVARLIGAPLEVKRKEGWVPILDTKDLADGTTKEVPYKVKIVDGYQIVDREYTVFLRRRGKEIAAIDPTCTHLGCRVHYSGEQDRFLCPCHGGVFNSEGGVISGPPPSPLIRHEVKVEGDKIWVRKAGVA